MQKGFTKERSVKHFQSQDTSLEVAVHGDDIGMIIEIGIIEGEVAAEVEAEASIGVIVIGVEEKRRGKENIAGEAGASALGDQVLITPKGEEEDDMMMSVEVVVAAAAAAEVVAVVVPWIVVLLVDKALVQGGVHLLEGVSLLEGVHLPGVEVLKEMVMVVEGLQLLGVFHREVDLLIHEAHLHKIQMLISEY